MCHVVSVIRNCLEETISKSDLDQVYFRSHRYTKCTVDLIYHLVIHDVLYYVIQVMNGWDLTYTIYDDFISTNIEI